MTEWKIYNIINKEYTIMFLLLFALTIGLITYKASKTILVSKVGLFISEQRWEVAKEIGEDMDYKHLEFQCLDPSF